MRAYNEDAVCILYGRESSATNRAPVVDRHCADKGKHPQSVAQRQRQSWVVSRFGATVALFHHGLVQRWDTCRSCKSNTFTRTGITAS